MKMMEVDGGKMRSTPLSDARSRRLIRQAGDDRCLTRARVWRALLEGRWWWIVEEACASIRRVFLSRRAEGTVVLVGPSNSEWEEGWCGTTESGSSSFCSGNLIHRIRVRSRIPRVCLKSRPPARLGSNVSPGRRL